jgi:cysteine-rich repeat protein
MKGVTPVIAAVLLIALAVISTVGLYFWSFNIPHENYGKERPISITVVPEDIVVGGISTFTVTNSDSKSLTITCLDTSAGGQCCFTGPKTLGPGDQETCTMLTPAGSPDTEIRLWAPQLEAATVIVDLTGGGAPVCGNGDLEGVEQCDDGNLVGGDCCDATCHFEALGSGCSDGNACTGGDQCNGAGTCVGTKELCCANSIDDDADGKTDYADTDCLTGWYHTYSFSAEEMSDVVVDSDGNYAAVGKGDAGMDGSTDQVLTKYNPNGDILLNKYYNAGDWADSASAVVNLTDSYGIAGTNSSLGLVYTGTITRVDKSTGALTWGKAYVTSTNLKFTDIIFDSPSFVVVGEYAGSWSKFFAMKVYAVNGTMIWAKNYTIASTTQFFTTAIVNDAANSQYVIAGKASFAGNTDIVVFGVYPNNGTLKWPNAYAYGSANPEDVTDIALAPTGASGPLIVAGQAWNGTDYDALLLNLGADGSYKWAAAYHDKTTHSEIANAISVSGASMAVAGNYIDPVNLDTEPMLFDTDAAGTLQWGYYYPDAAVNSEDYAYGLGNHSGTGFIIAGHASDFVNDDILMVRTYNNGTIPSADCSSYIGNPNLTKQALSWSATSKTMTTVDTMPAISVWTWNAPAANYGVAKSCQCHGSGC